MTTSASVCRARAGEPSAITRVPGSSPSGGSPAGGTAQARTSSAPVKRRAKAMASRERSLASAPTRIVFIRAPWWRGSRSGGGRRACGRGRRGRGRARADRPREQTGAQDARERPWRDRRARLGRDRLGGGVGLLGGEPALLDRLVVASPAANTCAVTRAWASMAKEPVLVGSPAMYGPVRRGRAITASAGISRPSRVTSAPSMARSGTVSPTNAPIRRSIASDATSPKTSSGRRSGVTIVRSGCPDSSASSYSGSVHARVGRGQHDALAAQRVLDRAGADRPAEDRRAGHGLDRPCAHGHHEPVEASEPPSVVRATLPSTAASAPRRCSTPSSSSATRGVSAPSNGVRTEAARSMKSPPGASSSISHAIARQRLQREDGLDRGHSAAGHQDLHDIDGMAAIRA